MTRLLRRIPPPTLRVVLRGLTSVCVSACISVCVTACTRDAPHESTADRALERRVTGVWDVTLMLEHSLRAQDAYPQPAAAAHGTLALLEHPVPRNLPFLDRAATHAGTFTLDVASLGFALRSDGTSPSLVAASSAPDSVTIVLPANVDDGVMVLHGRLAADSVSGVWNYVARAGGGWSGRFTMRPHR